VFRVMLDVPGWRVSVLDPAPAPGRHWLRHLCLTGSTAAPVLIFTWAQLGQGGYRDAHGAFGG
jgi:hypothetical protein